MFMSVSLMACGSESTYVWA